MLLLAEVCATLLDIGLGPWSVVGFEEGRNARAALQVACGHVDRLWELQYRDFCGGCTGVALVGAPLLRLLGDHVAVWKLVPAAFHLGLVAVVAGLLRRHSGPFAGAVAVAVFAAAPPALRELSLTGWGNHSEVRVLVFAAAALLLLPNRSWPSSLAAGTVTGLALWFAHIAAFALPALGMLAARRGRAGVAFAAGVPIGLVPLVLYAWSRPTSIAGTRQLWGTVGLADPGAWLVYLTGPLHGGVLWPMSDTPLTGMVPAVAFGLAVAAAAAGIAWSTTRRSPLGAFSLVAAVGFGAATFLRPDLWADVPTDPGFSAFHVRYRAVLWPLVPIGLGLLATGRPRLTAALAAPLLILGMGHRVVAWTGGPGPSLVSSVWHAPGRPDATVPSGQPVRRNPWSLDRAVDISAATTFLTGSVEPLPACRTDHAGELGRRIGLHVRRGRSPDPDLLPSIEPDVVAGVAWGLTAPAGRLPERTPGRLPGPWAAAVEQAVQRLHPAPHAAPDTIGTCQGLADIAWSRATEAGTRRATAAPPGPPTGCTDPERWKEALAIVSLERRTCPLAPGWPSCPAPVE